jgi:hypothetical protein
MTATMWRAVAAAIGMAQVNLSLRRLALAPAGTHG